MSDFLDLDLGDITAGSILKGAMNQILELAKNPASMPLASIFVGYLLKKSHIGASTIGDTVFTQEWTNWHAQSITDYQTYKERVLRERKDFLLDYFTWLQKIYEISEPVDKTVIQDRHDPGKPGMDLIIMIIPEDLGQFQLFGVTFDALPFSGKLFLSDLLIVGGVLALSAPALSAVGKTVGEVIPG